MKSLLEYKNGRNCRDRCYTCKNQATAFLNLLSLDGTIGATFHPITSVSNRLKFEQVTY